LTLKFIRKIAKLVSETNRLEAAQNEVERQLEYIETQQRDLSCALDVYEKQVNASLLEVASGSERHLADDERAKAYDLASSLNHHLDEMSRALTSLIADVNRMGGETAADDPLSQVVQILDAHLTSLEWIDRNAAELSARVDAVAKMQGTISSKLNYQRDQHATI
jgi:nuclear pore complex protein Nup62